MADVADLTQGEIDELLEGGDSNDIVELDDETILNGDNLDQNTKDSADMSKLQICEEDDADVSRDCNTIFEETSVVDSATEFVKHNAKTNTNGVNPKNVEPVTVLDSDGDDECQSSVVFASTSHKRRRKEATFIRDRNIARQIVVNSVASSDAKVNGYAINSIFKSIKKLHKEYKGQMDTVLSQVNELSKYTNTISNEVKIEKQARAAMKNKVAEVRKEIETLKKSCGLQQANRPIVQPLNVAYPPDHQIHNYSQHCIPPPPPPPPQQQQQPPRQVPGQYNHVAPMNVANNYITSSNPIRKRTSDHFSVPNDPRKAIRMEYPMMSNPRDSPAHRPPQPYQQSPHNNPTQFQIIDPISRGRAYGHTQNSQTYRIFLDAASTSNRDLVCLVPNIPKHFLNLAKKVTIANKPAFFKKYGSINVTVKIKSTKQDFSDNWQIAGFVDYSNIPNFSESTVQLYIQIQSMMPHLHGVIAQNNEVVDWGNSHVQDCNPSGKTKFRIKFHREQQTISEDHITVFAVISRDTVIDVAAAVSLQFR